jgi:kynurenine formamidase
VSTSDIPAEELGAGVLVTPERIAAAVRLVTQGRVFDLDAGRFRGMPQHEVHPGLEVTTYRSPRGEQNQGDLEFLQSNVNTVNQGFVTELLIGTSHTGTHIDALCHITRGANNEWYGGFSADKHLGDNGALKCDVTKIPPILARGVLLDVATAKQMEVLPKSYGITVEDVSSTLARQQTELRAGDIVLIRTGQMHEWPLEIRQPGEEAGITIEAARWLAGSQPVAIGADSSAVEVAPSGVQGYPQPVHTYLIPERGIYILEWVYLDDLARSGIYEFLFICLPLKIRGATGSMVRPVAVI